MAGDGREKIRSYLTLAFDILDSRSRVCLSLRGLNGLTRTLIGLCIEWNGARSLAVVQNDGEEDPRILFRELIYREQMQRILVQSFDKNNTARAVESRNDFIKDPVYIYPRGAAVFPIYGVARMFRREKEKFPSLLSECSKFEILKNFGDHSESYYISFK